MQRLRARGALEPAADGLAASPGSGRLRAGWARYRLLPAGRRRAARGRSGHPALGKPAGLPRTLSRHRDLRRAVRAGPAALLLCRRRRGHGHGPGGDRPAPRHPPGDGCVRTADSRPATQPQRSAAHDAGTPLGYPQPPPGAGGGADGAPPRGAPGPGRDRQPLRDHLPPTAAALRPAPRQHAPELVSRPAPGARLSPPDRDRSRGAGGEPCLWLRLRLELLPCLQGALRPVAATDTKAGRQRLGEACLVDLALSPSALHHAIARADLVALQIAALQPALAAGALVGVAGV